MGDVIDWFQQNSPPWHFPTASGNVIAIDFLRERHEQLELYAILQGHKIVSQKITCARPTSSRAIFVAITLLCFRIELFAIEACAQRGSWSFVSEFYFVACRMINLNRIQIGKTNKQRYQKSLILEMFLQTRVVKLSRISWKRVNTAVFQERGLSEPLGSFLHHHHCCHHRQGYRGQHEPPCPKYGCAGWTLVQHPCLDWNILHP